MPDQQQPSSPVPIAPPVPNPADPTNSVAGPYVPSHIQTGTANPVPVSAATPIDQRLFIPGDPATMPKSGNPFTQFEDNGPAIPAGMSFKDAFFSNDPKIQAAARGAMDQGIQKDPFFNTGGGNTIDTPYDQAKRYDSKLGFSPLRNNEAFYAANQGPMSTIANAAVNVVGKTAAYALQTIGIVGGAPVAALSANISNMTDNFVTRAADWLKDKTEEDFPIYKSDRYTNGSIFQKLATPEWWADDAMDRLGLTLAMFIPGIAEAKGFSLAGSIGADGVATGLGAKALQGIANSEGGFATVMKSFLPKLAEEAANGTANTGVIPAFKSYVQTLSRAEMGTWNVLGQSGLNAKESYDAVLKATGDKDLASTAATKSFLETLPLSMTNTLIELPQMFATMNTAKSMLSKVIDKETGLAMDPALVQGPGFLKSTGKALLTGLEHGQNESMQVAVGRYNETLAEQQDNAKKSGQPIPEDGFKRALGGIFGDFMDNINDPNGQNNIALGTIQGILTSVLGKGYSKINPNSPQNQEKTHLQNLYQMINSAQLNRRIVNGDFAQRNDDGSIRTDDKGKVVQDQQKLAQAGVSALGVDQALQAKQDAIAQGNYLQAAHIDHQALAGLAQAYFQDPGGYNHLQNLLKIEGRAAENNPDRKNDLDSQGNEITPKVQLKNNLDMLGQLKRTYDTIENLHAGILDLGVDRTNKIQVEAAKKFTGDLRNAQYHEAADQLFYTRKLADTQNALAALNLPEEAGREYDQHGLITEPASEAEEKFNDLKINEQALSAQLVISKAKYKAMIDKEKAREAFKQDQAAAQKTATTSVKPAAKAAAPATPSKGVEAAEVPTAPIAPVQQSPTQPVAAAAPVTATAPVQTTPVAQQQTPDVTPPIPAAKQANPQWVPGKYTIAPDNKGAFNVYDPEGGIFFEGFSQEEAQSYADEWNEKKGLSNLPVLVAEEQPAGDAPEQAPDPNSPAEVESQVLPPLQSPHQSEADNNQFLQQVQQSVQEEQTEYGKMIVNSFSVASKAAEYDVENGIGIKDDQGRPVFNTLQNTIIDFGKIVPGTKLTIQLQEMSDPQDPESAVISIHAGTALLGYMHDTAGAQRLLTSSVDKDAEIKKLQDMRSQIIAAGRGVEFSATVEQTGFGFPNRGDARGYHDIHEATGGDTNTILAVKKGGSFVGEKGAVFNTRFGDGIREGAMVLMLPNNVNGQEVLIPTYVSAKPVGTDPRIREIVEKGITAYLSTGDKKELNSMRDYVYVTESGAAAINLTNNGLFLDATGILRYRGQDVRDLGVADVLSKVQVNINAAKLNSPAYVKSMRTSPSIQTTFFARTRDNAKSYFHQHTIQFSITNQSPSNGKVQSDQRGVQHSEDVQQEQPDQNSGQAETVLQGNGQRSDANGTGLHTAGQEVGTSSPADLIRQQGNIIPTDLVEGETRIHPVSFLRTMNLGNREGTVENEDARAEFEAAVTAGNERFGGGETIDEVKQRVIPSIQKILDSAPDNTIIVTHSSILKLIRVWNRLGRPALNTITKGGGMANEFNRLYNEMETETGDVIVLDKGINKTTGQEEVVIIVRHGETTDNLEGKYRTSGTQLTAKGIQQAIDAAKIIRKKAVLGKDDTPPLIITSDLDRTIHTSQLIRAEFNEEDKQALLDQMNQDLLNELGDEGFIVDDLPDTFDISEAGVESIAAQPSSLVLPGFTAFLQEDAVGSISQLLLADDVDKKGLAETTAFGTTPDNKTRVKEMLAAKLAESNAKLEKYAALLEQRNPTILKVQQAAKGLQMVLDNYDQLHQIAVDRLEKNDLQHDEQGYYFAVDNDDDFLRFDDDSEYTKNNYDSLGKLVKQFISFNAEKIEDKDGKAGNRMNSLGLPTIVKPAAVYTRMINWLSERYFAPTFEGFANMVSHLNEIPDPTVKDIAGRLARSQNAQLKFQFFANMSKFKTNHIQQLTTLNENGVFAKNIEANRNQMAKVVVDQMAAEFLDNSNVLSITQDDYGNTIKRVDKAQVTPYLFNETGTGFFNFYNDSKSYGTRKDDGGKNAGSRFLRPEAADKMYAVLRELGFTFSKQAFTRAITSQTGDNPRGDAKKGLEILFTGGNRILRNMAEGDHANDDRDMYNPFVANPDAMNFIARIESNYRPVTQTDSFRSNGKSYYPFTRMSFVKSIFQQISEFADSGTLTPMLKTFLWDPFKKVSQFLQKAREDRTFSPSLWFARGQKMTGTKGTNEEIKDMNEKKFILSKVFAHQNQGNRNGLFFSDTYSDKTTRFQVKAPKISLPKGEDGKATPAIVFDEKGRASIHSSILAQFYNYFQGELGRVNLVRDHNTSLADEYRISGFHDLKGKEGIGKYFVIFNFLNQENLDNNVARVIYGDDGKVLQTPEAEAAVKGLINRNLVHIINNYQEILQRNGLFTDPDGHDSVKGVNDTAYYNILSRTFDDYMSDNQKKFMVAADYVLNASLNSLEMLTLTGDPAQSPKIAYSHGQINLNASIRKTLVEVSKRNASLNAPFDQGISIQPTYRVGFLKDLKINSDQMAEYRKLLPALAKAVEDGYKNGDMTDAQEVTTVRQHLINLLSLGRISPMEMIQALAHFDPVDFNRAKPMLADMLRQLGIDYTLNRDTLRRETASKDMSGYLQVIKPVQRFSRWDPNLSMNVETYIKTSSFPLVPDLVKGKDFEEVLKQMQDNNIDRLNFASGTKQGLINPQSIYTEDGTLNSSLFTNNVIELPAAAWGEQGQNPEKDELKSVEGSQQQRMIFVDLPDDEELDYKGEKITGKDLREKYINDHKTIFQAKRDQLFKELGIDSTNDVNSFSTLRHLSDILQREGADRDYDTNTLLSLSLNSAGQFEVPMTFLPNSSEIQSLIAAVISNRILKNKLPGTSLIQGSEMVIKTNGKVKVSADVSQANNGIVWAKPEYASINKLQYIRVENGQVKPAQIVLPFYFKTKNGGSVPLSDFTNKDGYLDTSKIDPDLLEINGFRIPYAGPNSGMWFEVVGYLPETMGSLVIVPAEVAAQMGADYDVDKLFTYVLNHTVSDDGIRVDASTPQKAAENDIILAHKAVYLNKSRLSKTVEPTSTDELDSAVDNNLPKGSQEMTQIYDPAHQDNVWLSNRAGQLGVGISANYNTFHSLAQQAHLFTKGDGVKFLDSNGRVYNETTNTDAPDNTISGKIDRDLYNFGEEENALTEYGINRLDRIDTFPNPFTDRTIPIASVINNWLQASVDNAKLQLLGAAGINKYNFNVALTIALHGFDSNWIIPFINQPILKEYYASVQNIGDQFSTEFIMNERDVVIGNLFKKYVDKLGVDKYDYETYKGLSHNTLFDGVRKNFNTMDAEDFTNQLEVFKQFLNLEKVGSTMSGISSDTKVEVRGLSKSFAEINQQARDIDSLGESAIGGINRLRKDTVAGVYLDVPGMIDGLFSYSENPLFGYSTPVYRSLKDSILAMTGRNMNAEQLDDMYKEIKQFIYTHPSMGLHTESSPLPVIKDNLLVKGNLAEGWQDMKARYPNSILLSQLSQQTKIRTNDPDVLTMQNAAEDISTQIKQEWLDFFKSTDPELVTFINHLTTYALLFGSKEYGPSNMLRFIPFEVLKGMGFGDKLNVINRQLAINDVPKYANFVRQFIQHNPDMAKFISMRNMPNSKKFEPGTDGKDGPVVGQFTMPNPTQDLVMKNTTIRSLVVPVDADTFTYRKYVRTYVNDVIPSALYELQPDNRTYKRIDTLGNQYINEYDFANPDARTIFPLRQAAQQSTQTESSPVAAKDNPNPTVDDITAIYASNAFTRSDSEGKPMSANDALDTIQLRAGTSDNPVDQLHYQLAAALAGRGTYQLVFSQDEGYRGRTFHDQNKINISPKEIQRIAASLGTSYEQELQRTILHEVIHNATDEYMHVQSQLPEHQQSTEFKQLRTVYNTYRKDLVTSGSSTYVRGIQDTFLQAELFKALFEKFHDNATGRAKSSIDISSIFKNWDRVKTNQQDLLGVIHTMQASMKQAVALHGVARDANFDLVKKNRDGVFEPIDTERVAQVVDYLDKHFSNENAADLKAKYYAYVNPVEFNTMAMTSPGFMHHLDTVQGLNTDKTLWDRFKDIIKRIVSSFNGHSLLNDAINSVLNITKAATAKEVADAKPADVAKDTGDTPPWEAEAPAPTSQQTVKQTIPTTDNAQSFTFKDGVTIPTPGMVLNPQQREGLQKMADFVEAWRNGSGHSYFTLAGFAGTGKSSTIKFLVQYLNKKLNGQLQFQLSTPTHKANKVLGRFFRGTINKKPITTSSLLGYKQSRDPVTNKFVYELDENRNKIPGRGLLIVDEASFIGEKGYKDILAAASQKRAMVIFMGDIAQIPSPDGSNKVSPVFGLPDKMQLTQVMRQADGNPLATIYDRIRNNMMVKDLAALFDHKTDINTKGEGIEYIAGDYKSTGKLLRAAIDVFKSAEFKTNKMVAKIVAYGNPTVESYNRGIREAILEDATQDFQIGEILMGYEQRQLEGPVQNGQDYEITSRKYEDHKPINIGKSNVELYASGFNLGIKEADNAEDPGNNTFVLNAKDLRNQPFLQHYVSLLELLKTAKGRDYYAVNEMLEALERQALIPEAVYPYQGHVYTNSMLRESFPNLFRVDETTGKRPIDNMTAIAKNLDYGYAVTAHKVQGSTYKQVFVDENNIEFDQRIINDTNNKPLMYERNSLLYVALSRPTTKATVLSRHAVSDTNTHQASPAETQENRSVSQTLQQPSATQPTINMSDTGIQRIEKGNKTMMNSKDLIRDGIYYLKGGTKIQVNYNGEAVVDTHARKVTIMLDPDNEEDTPEIYSLDDYARKEGYTDWADFQKSAPASAEFIEGNEVRFSYLVKKLGIPDASDIMEELKKDNSLKKNC